VPRWLTGEGHGVREKDGLGCIVFAFYWYCSLLSSSQGRGEVLCWGVFFRSVFRGRHYKTSSTRRPRGGRSLRIKLKKGLVH